MTTRRREIKSAAPQTSRPRPRRSSARPSSPCRALCRPTGSRSQIPPPARRREPPFAAAPSRLPVPPGRTARPNPQADKAARISTPDWSSPERVRQHILRLGCDRRPKHHDQRQRKQKKRATPKRDPHPITEINASFAADVPDCCRQGRPDLDVVHHAGVWHRDGDCPPGPPAAPPGCPPGCRGAIPG